MADLMDTLQAHGVKGVGGYGTVLTAGADLMQGFAQRQTANSVAAQLRQQAIASRATAQRQAADIQLRGDYLQSHARAAAAASGGSASDPTVVNDIADIAGQTDLRRLTAIASGENEGRGLEYAATVRQREGTAAMYGGAMGAYGTILKGQASAAAKYGWDDGAGGAP